MKRVVAAATLLVMLAGCSGGEFKRVGCVPKSLGFDQKDEKLFAEDQGHGWIFSTKTKKIYEYEEFYEALRPYPSPFSEEAGTKMFVEGTLIGKVLKVRMRFEDDRPYTDESIPANIAINLQSMTGKRNDADDNNVVDTVCRYFPVTQNLKADG